MYGRAFAALGSCCAEGVPALGALHAQRTKTTGKHAHAGERSSVILQLAKVRSNRRSQYGVMLDRLREGDQMKDTDTADKEGKNEHEGKPFVNQPNPRNIPGLDQSDRGDGTSAAEGMTLEELQEAIEDERHPQHADALKQSKELADKMGPALQLLQQQVLSQVDISETFKSISDHAMPKSVADTFGDAFVKMARDAIPEIRMPDLKGKIEWESVIPEASPVALSRAHQQDFAEIGASVADANRERNERAEHQVELSIAQLATLETMAANLQQLNQQMEDVDNRLTENNESATKWSCWIVVIASLTLLATVAGIIVTAVLSQS